MVRFYSIANIRYVLSDKGDCLIKAGTKDSPGQMGLFDESLHPRDETGKFAVKETVATPKVATGLEPVIAKTFVRDLKSSEYGKLSKQEAEYEGLDYDHPGAHWEGEGGFDRLLDLYRDGGDRAVGREFLNLVSSNTDSESIEKISTTLAKYAFEQADWEKLSQYARSQIMGQSASLDRADPVTHVIADFIARDIEVGLEGEENPDDEEWLKEAKQYRERASNYFASAESLQQWARKEKVWDVSRDETETATRLVQLTCEQLDADEIGKQIAGHLQFPKAIAREQVTGRKGSAVIDWKQSESGRDSGAWDGFEKMVDWQWVGTYAKHEVEHPGTPIPASVEDTPTRVAMEVVGDIVRQDGGDFAKKLNTYDPGHISKLQIQEKIGAYPQIRSLMESEEGHNLQINIDQNKVFQKRIRSYINDLLNSRWKIPPVNIARELAIDSNTPDWRQQTVDRLSQNFGVTREQLQKLGLIA